MVLKFKRTCIVSFILFIGMSIWLRTSPKTLMAFDKVVAKTVKNWDDITPLVYIGKVITHLADFNYCLILAVLIMIFLFFKRWYYTGALFMIAYIGTRLLRNFFKNINGRPRPNATDSLIGSSGSSFPSGHMLYATVFYGFILFLLVYLLIQNGKRTAAKMVGLAFGLFLILIGLSRVFLGVHYTSDVIAGFLLGVAWLSFILMILWRLWVKKMY